VNSPAKPKVRRRPLSTVGRAKRWLVKHRVILQAVARFLVGFFDGLDRYLDTLDDDGDDGDDPPSTPFH